jgi:hypothetical protein
MMLQANQALMGAMASYFEQKAKSKKKEPMLDDESAAGDTTSRPSKFTDRRAASVHGWAGFPPSHLFKSLPSLFRDIVEGSTTERHGTITGFFCHLERQNPRTFGGFHPSDDLVDDIAKFKFAPPKGYGDKWHRGIGPMAFAERSLGDLDRQTENRELRDEYGAQLHLTLVDAKKLASATPLVPMKFEAFLLLLERYSEFHLAAFGPDCDLHKKTKLVIQKLTILRQRILRSGTPFMSSRAPTIIWALTLATQAFYAEAATASQFDHAKENESPPPFVVFDIDVDDLSTLQLTEACDLPSFLRRFPAEHPT